MSTLDEIQELLNNLCGDRTISKNVREALEDIREDLKTDGDVNVKIDAALQKVEGLSLDPNLSSHSRTQLWNLTSLLESAQNSK